MARRASSAPTLQSYQPGMAVCREESAGREGGGLLYQHTKNSLLSVGNGPLFCNLVKKWRICQNNSEGCALNKNFSILCSVTKGLC